MEAISGAIRGMGSSLSTMIISVFGICILRVVWIYTIFAIPQWHTPECLFLSYPITWIITIIAYLIAFIVVIKKKQKQALAEA
jgi:Na+-driven multidrug efflux pump